MTKKNHNPLVIRNKNIKDKLILLKNIFISARNALPAPPARLRGRF
jgi:hypothetical protein